ISLSVVNYACCTTYIYVSNYGSNKTDNLTLHVALPICEVDIYVNNAGAMLSAAVTYGELTQWETMIDVNIKGVLYGLHQVLPDMIERKTGHIINIASVSGHEVTKKSTVYSATKFAVRAI